jgi:hypothetical protein
MGDSFENEVGVFATVTPDTFVRVTPDVKVLGRLPSW